MLANLVQNSAKSANTADTSGRSSEVASSATKPQWPSSIVAVGEAVAREQHALACVETPPGRAQIADHRLDRHQAPAAEVDLVALVHPAHAVLVLRERQMIVADVAAQDRIRKGLEHAAEPAAMRGLLVGDEQIF